MLTLGIDTSCDETSVAVLKDNHQILSNIISSQIKLHSPHGGVVPELASRSHIEAIPKVVQQALSQAQISFEQLDGIAVTTSPGLIGCLLVGLSYAKGLAYSLNIPLTQVHHLKAHLFSPFIEEKEKYPFIGLVVSGGHTALYEVQSFNDIKILGQTVDDALGEAYDKVARLLGLGYPGGPIVDRLAQKGDDSVFKFTRAKVKKGPTYFSFSGLKTAVSLLIKKQKKLDETFIQNLSASFQKEAILSLVEKIRFVCSQTHINRILISGGVALNSRLRLEMKTLAENENLEYLIARPSYCTDNGAMVAYVGKKQLDANIISTLDSNASTQSKIW